MGTPSDAAAVLFADVVGSTALYEKLGDAEALRRVQACLAALRVSTERAGGELVKTIGDEVMCVFADAASAAIAAAEMQAVVSRLPVEGDIRLSVRIGFHAGPLLRLGGDVFGDTVNVAARVAGLAKARQILASDAARAQLPRHLEPLVRPLGGVALKGRNARIEICELLWDASQDMTLVAGEDADPAAHPGAAAILLTMGARAWRLDAGALVVGRDASSDIRVSGPRVSRQHARIETRGGKFVLIDSSTNGTFVQPDDGQALQLKREELVLRGRGRISFGDAVDAAGAQILEYDCGDAQRSDSAPHGRSLGPAGAAGTN